MECNCTITFLGTYGDEPEYEIIRCPMHQAAQELLEVAKEIQFESNRNCLGPIIRRALDAAIKAAAKEE